MGRTNGSRNAGRQGEWHRQPVGHADDDVLDRRAAPEMFFPMIESQHKRLELDWLNTRWIVELGIVDSGADRVRLHLIRTIRHQ